MALWRVSYKQAPRTSDPFSLSLKLPKPKIIKNSGREMPFSGYFFGLNGKSGTLYFLEVLLF